MGKSPPSGDELQRLLMGERAAALSSLEFFARVAPLARRLGMNKFPAYEAFSSRFYDTEDINTNLLRADGQILKHVHATAVAQVDHQREQDASLVSCWPDGSGVVARQQLRAHLARADGDVGMLDDVATGLLVAADCIDVSRLAKFVAIGTISPDTLLGMPIGYWLSHQAASVFGSGDGLRAAITASVNLFGSAVNTCDQAIDVILSGLCQALAGMNTSEYPVGGDVGRPAASPVPVGATGSGGETGSGRDTAADGSGGSSPTSPTTSSTPETDPSSALPRPGAALPMALIAGTPTAGLGQTTSALANVAGGQMAGLLGPIIGVVGQAVTAAVAGVVEAVVSAQASAPIPMPGEPSGTAEPSGPASITLGDKIIEVKAGADGVSVNLTVRESGAAPDIHTLDVGSDGTVSLRGTDDQEKEALAEESVHVPVAPAPAPVPEPQPEPSEIQDSPPEVAAESEAEQVNPVPHPHPSDTSNERDTQVAPQSSAPEESLPPDDGVLALAGDQ